MRYFLILYFVLLGSLAAETCHTKRELVIACTARCRDTYKLALQEAAQALNLKVRVISLLEEPSAKYDAILSPGGGDIHYRYYTDHKFNRRLPKVKIPVFQIQENYEKFSGERDPKGLARDQFEMNLWQRYFSDQHFKQVPALGICYGMQMLGVANGLPMHVDIENTFGIPARRKVLEKVDIDGEAPAISEIKKPFYGHYNHHQALRYHFYKENLDYYRNDFEIIASSNKGQIPEMLHFKKRPAFGVQFHPERLTGKYRSNALAIFRWFVNAACQKANFESRQVPQKSLH